MVRALSQLWGRREYLPDDWDLESTASLDSDLRRLDHNIKTISQMISNEKDLQLYQIEPKAPGKIITCFFSTCFFAFLSPWFVRFSGSIEV